MSLGEWPLVLMLLPVSVVLACALFAAYRLTRPSVVAVMFWVHLAVAVYPGMLFLMEPDREYAGAFLVAAVVGAVLIPVGGLLGEAVLPSGRGAIGRFYSAHLEVSPPVTSAVKRLVILLLAVNLLLLILYIRGAGGLFPIRDLIMQSVSPREMQSLRRAASPGEVGGLTGLGRAYLVPFMFVTILVSWRWLGGAYKAWGLVGLGLAVLYQAYSGAKTPVAQLFVVAILMGLIIRHERGAVGPSEDAGSRHETERRVGRWQRKAFFAVGISTVLAYPMLVYSLGGFARARSLSLVFRDGYIGRIVYRPAVNAYHAFEWFGSEREFTWFADVRKLAGLMGWEAINLSREMAMFKGQSAITNAPPPTLGRFYAQAGWWGVVVGFLVAALVFKLAENMILRTQCKTPVHVALYAMLLYGAYRFGVSYFHTVLFTEAIVPTIVMLLVWHFGFRWRKTRDRSGPPTDLADGSYRLLLQSQRTSVALGGHP